MHAYIKYFTLLSILGCFVRVLLSIMHDCQNERSARCFLKAGAPVRRRLLLDVLWWSLYGIAGATGM